MTTNGTKSHTDRIRELAAYVEEMDDVSTVTETHVHVHADASGAFKAMETTKPDNPRPQQESIPEQVADGVTKVVTVAGMSWRHVTVLALLALVALAAIAAYVVLHR